MITFPFRFSLSSIEDSKRTLELTWIRAALVIRSVQGSTQRQRGLVSAPIPVGCCTPRLNEPQPEGSGSPPRNGDRGRPTSQASVRALGGQTDGRGVQCSLKKPLFLLFQTKTFLLQFFSGYS